MVLSIGIFDFGVGNLKSIFQVFEKLSLNIEVYIIKDIIDLKKIDKLILPGQGCSFTYIEYLNNNDFSNYFLNFCNSKKVMGICVGKHIFFESSDEIKIKNNCLSFFSGFVKKFTFKKNFLFRIPNINWNKVKIINDHYLINEIPDLQYFYFSHSYYLTSSDLNFVYGIINYNLNFSTIFIKDNIFLTQFHPEKSSFLGLKLFYNFINWN